MLLQYIFKKYYLIIKDSSIKIKFFLFTTTNNTSCGREKKYQNK